MHARIFTLKDQIAFAELSGDNNPLHIDPVLARRSLFGQSVVHGVHTLMWALDQWLEGRAGLVRLKHLRVTFLKAIGINQEIRYKLVSEINNRIRIDVLDNDDVVVRAVFEWSTYRPFRPHEVSPEPPPHPPP
ncbi:MAG: MaoC family dehydratase, partial [Verrucomicrobiota bacterium]